MQHVVPLFLLRDRLLFELALFDLFSCDLVLGTLKDQAVHLFVVFALLLLQNLLGCDLLAERVLNQGLLGKSVRALFADLLLV